MEKLRDKVTNEILFGGGAGGAKSDLGCSWQISCCYEYPGYRGFIAREELKNLRLSTLLTFWEVCGRWGLKPGIDVVYKQQDSVLFFPQTGSTIALLELSHRPGDPQYDYLGSREYSGGFIEEAQQVSDKAKNVLMSRIRYKLDDFGIIPKMLMTCNPNKGFIYHEFYKPWKEGKLPPDKAFIQALAKDNPFIAESYMDTLRKLDKVSKERLLYGNWEYDDDPSVLMDYDAISDIFANKHVLASPDPRDVWMTADVARFGGDKIVVMIWKGWRVVKIVWRQFQGIDETIKLLDDMEREWKVPRSHQIVDDDGVGGGVVDMRRGTRPFNGGAKAQGGENYFNLRCQSGYRLAEKVNAREIGVDCDDKQVRQWIVEELEQIKRDKVDQDGPLRIVPKERMKEALGRSPDFYDALAMRTFKPPQIGIIKL